MCGEGSDVVFVREEGRGEREGRGEGLGWREGYGGYGVDVSVIL